MKSAITMIGLLFSSTVLANNSGFYMDISTADPKFAVEEVYTDVLCEKVVEVPLVIHVNDNPLIVKAECGEKTYLVPFDDAESTFVYSELYKHGSIYVDFRPTGWVMKDGGIDIKAYNEYFNRVRDAFVDIDRQKFQENG